MMLVIRMRSIRNRTIEMKAYPVTAQRQLLLKLSRDAHGHIDAKELYRCASREDQSVSLATVHRGLHLF